MKNHIVCLSTTNYHPLPTRKQNVMSRLRNSEILYFDPPVSMIAPLKEQKSLQHISKSTSSPAKRSKDTKTSPFTHCRRYCRFSTSSAGSTKSTRSGRRRSSAKRCASMASVTRPCCGAIRRPRAILWSTCRTPSWYMTV